MCYVGVTLVLRGRRLDLRDDLTVHHAGWGALRVFGFEARERHALSEHVGH